MRELHSRIMVGLFFLIIIPAQHLYSQSYVQNLKKYWSYRYRFIGDDIDADEWQSPGFIKVGAGEGYSIPVRLVNGYDDSQNKNYAWIYNPTGNNNRPGPCTNQFIWPFSIPSGYDGNNLNHEFYSGILKWSDTPTDLGLYLGVLATEWTALKKYGQNTDRTEQELYLALEAINRLDLYAEKAYYGGQNGTISQQQGVLNGFFYRDDVPWDFARGNNFGSQFENVSSGASCFVDDGGNGECGDGGHNKWWTHDYESQDQLIKLLYGLSFVVKLVPDGLSNSNLPDPNLKLKAMQIADRLISYVNQDPMWRIKDPDGDNVCRGSNALNYSWGLAESIDAMARWSNYSNQNFHNSNSSTTGWNRWAAQKIGYWVFYGLGNWNAHLSKVNDDMFGDLAVMMFGSSKKVIAKLGTAIGHPDYDLARLVLNDDDGYYSPNDLYYSSGNVFRSYLNGGDCQTPPAEKLYEADNGLMYMLLFNLYSMVFNPIVIDLAKGIPLEYPNIMDRDVTATYPLSAPQLGTVTSPINVRATYNMTNHAHLQPQAHVDFFAPHITLTPGFIAESGSVSLIEPRKMDCSDDYGVTLFNSPYDAAKWEGEDEEAMESNKDWGIDSNKLAEFKNFLNGDMEELPKFMQELMADTLQANNTSHIQSADFSLNVYPNPFKDNSIVSFNLDESSIIHIALMDMAGRSIKTIADNEHMEKGQHRFGFNRENIANGVYLLTYNDDKGHIVYKQIAIQ